MTGCHETRLSHPSETQNFQAVRAQIEAVLSRQVEAWNRGDVETYMEGYWRSPELTFSSRGKVTRGYEPTLEHYRRSYPDKATMGTLTFSELEITPLCPHTALVLGRWRIEGHKPAGGAFSLTMQRIDSHWLIVHDHTSRDAT
jgi:beta-aspartyl-peptidase (threonine type)